MKKHLYLFALVLITALFQNTVGLLPAVFGAVFWPLVPLTVAVGMRGGEMAGLVYGMIGGAFWDVASSGTDGVHALCLAVIGFAAGWLVKFLLRDTMLSFYAMTAGAVSVIAAVEWLVFTLIPVGDLGARLLVRHYIPSAIITAAFGFICRLAVDLTKHAPVPESALPKRGGI